jgi:hypothetical protein
VFDADKLDEAILAREAAMEVAKSELMRTVIAKGERISKIEIELFRDVLFGLLEADHPQSVRHVFYLMTDHRLPFHVEKTEEGYRQVQRQLFEMRKQGLLPYGWITDATRMGWHVYTYRNAADFIRRMHGAYRADIWARSDAYCEVWVESRSIASVVRNDCNELGVSLYPAGGFSSLTLPYEAAQDIADTVRDTAKTIEIVYIGDYDPAGVLIDCDIERKLRGHLDDAGIDNPLTLHPIAITPAQIARYDLPTKPRKDGDKRAKHVEHTVEAEALPAHILRDLLRTTVESFLPEGALTVAKAAEESERGGQSLLRLADRIERGRIKL